MCTDGRVVMASLPIDGVDCMSLGNGYILTSVNHRIAVARIDLFSERAGLGAGTLVAGNPSWFPSATRSAILRAARP